MDPVLGVINFGYFDMEEILGILVIPKKSPCSKRVQSLIRTHCRKTYCWFD